MTVKSKYTIIEFVVFSIGITSYIKIEAKNEKIHGLEQMHGGQFKRMSKIDLY